LEFEEGHLGLVCPADIDVTVRILAKIKSFEVYE